MKPGRVAQIPFSLEPLAALARALAPESTFALEPMPGGASLRKFYRVSFAGGQRAVGMFFPDSRPEEIGKTEEVSQRWPFIEVLELLESKQVRVPRLLGQDTAQGWLLVEDFGDRTLAEELERAPARKRALYQAAVRDLALSQRRLAELPEHCVVKRRAFDLELLIWELDHFREYGLEAQGIALSRSHAQRFGLAARAIAEQIRAFDYGFVHRDYQSRNLMVLDEQATATRSGLLGWVDFQDALLGPRVYDLVALLNDSYQSFDDDFIRERLEEYVLARGLPSDAIGAIEREFALVTIQRKLKDAGRFVYIDRVKGDPSYLRFFEPSLEKVRRAMSKLQDLPHVAELTALLEELVPRR